MRLKLLPVILIVFNAPLFIYIHLTPRIQEFVARFISPCGVENRTEFDFIILDILDIDNDIVVTTK